MSKKKVPITTKKDDSSSDTEREKSKIVSFEDLPGNSKRRRKPKPDPKPEEIKQEPITIPLKPEKKPEPKPEPMIIPLKPEKVKERTVTKEEAKLVMVPQVTEVIKTLKERKVYPKKEEYENFNVELDEPDIIIRKFFRPKIKKKQLDENMRAIETSLEHESDGSFVEIEMPITVIQKDYLPENPIFHKERQFEFCLIGKIKPEIKIDKISDGNVSIKRIRENKGGLELCDYMEELDEVSISNIMALALTFTSFTTFTIERS